MKKQTIVGFGVVGILAAYALCNFVNLGKANGPVMALSLISPILYVLTTKAKDNKFFYFLGALVAGFTTMASTLTPDLFRFDTVGPIAFVGVVSSIALVNWPKGIKMIVTCAVSALTIHFMNGFAVFKAATATVFPAMLVLITFAYVIIAMTDETKVKVSKMFIKR